MDSFGRLLDDVLQYVRTLYYLPIITLEEIDNKYYYIIIKFPYGTCKFELFELYDGYNMNYYYRLLKALRESIDRITNLQGSHKFLFFDRAIFIKINTTISISNNARINTLTIPIECKDALVSVLNQYYDKVDAFCKQT
jgi:hypothetical protein